MSRRWIINSKYHRMTATTWGDTVTVDLRTLVPKAALSSIRVRKVAIPYLGWNVLDDNNAITLTVLGDTFNITIAPGYYSRASLSNAIMSAANAAMAASTYSLVITYDRTTFLSTFTVYTSDTIITPFTLSAPTTTSPSILALYGFADTTITTGAVLGGVTSEGALNIIMDRCLYITCDEAKGEFGKMFVINGPTWQNGIICTVPLEDGITLGDVVSYQPEDDAPWVDLVRGSSAGLITFRLSRSSYARMGGGQIDWMMELEVRHQMDGQ